MPLINEYIGLTGPATFGAIDVESGCSACSITPPLSQICKILYAPHGSKVPQNWETAADFLACIDNEDTTDSSIKQLPVIGALSITEINTQQGRTYNLLCRRNYQIEAKTPVSPLSYDFARVLERNWTGFRFWFLTLSGYLYGGQNGIQVHKAAAALPKNGEEEAHEEAIITLLWFADGSPDRVYVPGLLINAN